MLTRLSQRLHNVRTLAGAGIIRPARPDRLVRVARAWRGSAPRPPPATPACAARYPNDTGDHRRAGHAHVRRDARAHERARARPLRRRHRRGRQRRGHVPQPPRLHRRHGRRSKLGADAPVPEHGVRRRRRSPTWSSARSRARSSSTRSSTDLVAGRRRAAASASSRWHEDEPSVDDPTLEYADRGGRRRPTPCRRPRRAAW